MWTDPLLAPVFHDFQYPKKLPLVNGAALSQAL
jgi:hypothetical protein